MPTDATDLVYFFCVGPAKSGTTLLARVLDQHPDVACIWESYAFHPYSRASIFNPASDSWRKHGFDEGNVRRWASIWRAQPRAILRRALRRLTGRTVLATSCYRKTMPEALADFSQRCGARIVGDKWPRYIDHLEDVLAVFPAGKYIYNVRDPRGLWNSAQTFRGRQRGDELLRRMLSEDQRIQPYLERPNFLVFRYEELVRTPQA
ncbi:MAG: sulfotransferase family protein, partial [Anaerolineae bacterium]